MLLTKESILLLALLIAYSNGAFINLKAYENEWLNKVLLDPLNNKYVRPTILNTSESIEISVSFFVETIEVNDGKDMEFGLNLKMVQEWEDDRLAYAKYNPVQLRQLKYLTLLEPDKIWTPDTYFKNEKSANMHSMTKQNSYARIYPNGTVLFNTRLSLKLSCEMNLRLFPFDTQICSVQFGSFGFARDDLIYKWKPVPTPISKGTNLVISPEFALKSITSNYCDGPTSSGVFSCLVAEFQLQRSHSHYLKYNFIPITNFVLIGWLSFLLDYNKERTFLLRGVLCLGALLMAFYKSGDTGKRTAHVPYTTAMDVWNGISLTFVFYALVEFIAVYFISTHEVGGKAGRRFLFGEGSRKGSGDEEQLEMGTKNDPEGRLQEEPENMEIERKKSVEVQTALSSRLFPEKLERLSIIFYPIVFFCFNLIYWAVTANVGEN